MNPFLSFRHLNTVWMQETLKTPKNYFLCNFYLFPCHVPIYDIKNRNFERETWLAKTEGELVPKGRYSICSCYVKVKKNSYIPTLIFGTKN